MADPFTLTRILRGSLDTWAAAKCLSEPQPRGHAKMKRAASLYLIVTVGLERVGLRIRFSLAAGVERVELPVSQNLVCDREQCLKDTFQLQ